MEKNCKLLKTIYFLLKSRSSILKQLKKVKSYYYYISKLIEEHVRYLIFFSIRLQCTKV